MFWLSAAPLWPYMHTTFYSANEPQSGSFQTSADKSTLPSYFATLQPQVDSQAFSLSFIL